MFSMKWVVAWVAWGKRTIPSAATRETRQDELDESHQHKRIYWGLEGQFSGWLKELAALQEFSSQHPCQMAHNCL